MSDEAVKTQQTQVEQESSVENLLTMLAEDEQKTALQEFITRLGKDYQTYRVNGALVDACIAEIDQIIGVQMDEILHHEEFQRLESTWRGLQFLVDSAKFSKPVTIELLDASKEELAEDLEEAAGDYQNESALWHHIYWGAYDKVGGHPYTCIVSDYQFDSTPKDIELMEHLSVLGEMAQLPFVGNASAKFFGMENFEQVMSERRLEEIVKDDPKFMKWHSFRNDDRSKYIGLCLPRFLGRLPYDPEQEPTKNFDYREQVYRNGQDHSLWVNASFAFAANMVRSFEEWGWSVKVVGVDSGGRVDGLPTPTYEEHGQVKVKVPVEASVGQAKDQELSDMGFIPLAHWDRTDYACFFQAPSVQRPKEIKGNDIATANSRLGAQLQYTMLVTRIAHYLKYRQLRFVGRNAGAGEIKRDLSSWLDQIVSDFPNPTEDVVAERPLRSYTLEVNELPDKPGFFQIVAEFRPHVAIVGFDIKLRLVAYHSTEE